MRVDSAEAGPNQHIGRSHSMLARRAGRFEYGDGEFSETFGRDIRMCHVVFRETEAAQANVSSMLQTWLGSMVGVARLRTLYQLGEVVNGHLGRSA